MKISFKARTLMTVNVKIPTVTANERVLTSLVMYEEHLRGV